MNIGSIFERAWGSFTRHAAIFVIATLICLGIRIPISFVLASVPGGWIVDTLVGTLVQAFFMAGFAMMAGKAVSGATPVLEDLFVAFRDRPVEYIVAGMAVQIGVLACGIGAIVSAFLFLFAPMMVADGMKGMDAVRKSMDVVMRDPGNFVVLFLALIGLGVASVITCGIGALVAAPLGQLAIAVAYVDLKNAGTV